MNFQEKRDISSFVSVVVLDEVGLAEASPYLPLKALHPLLEDGTEGSGSADQVHQSFNSLKNCLLACFQRKESSIYRNF